MGRVNRLCFGLSVAALSASCSPEPPTALVVAVVPEANAASHIARVEITVKRGEAERFDNSYLIGSEASLPGTITFEKAKGYGASETLQIGVVAYEPGTGKSITRNARLGFVQGKTKLLRMPLSLACLSVECVDGKTCDGGACVPDGVDVEQLPDFESNTQAVKPLPSAAGGSGGSGGAAGEAGAGGSAGVAGQGGSSGKGGQAGESGKGGSSGNSGQAGQGGSSGKSGQAGQAGQAGASGQGGSGGQAGAGPTGQGTLGLGNAMSCAITPGQQVMCWGAGRGATEAQGPIIAAPSLVAGLAGVTQLAGADEQVCALTSGKQIYCWGHASSGQTTGDGTDVAPTELAHVIGGAGASVDEVTASSRATCYRAGGQVSCFGAGDDGALGNGASSGIAAVSPVAGVGDALALSRGTGSITCALRPALAGAGKRVTCWGAGVLTPQDVPGVSDAAQVAVADTDILVIRRDDGSVVATGRSNGAQAWDAPVALDIGGKATVVSASATVCAARDDGAVVCADAFASFPEQPAFAPIEGLPAGDAVVELSAGVGSYYGQGWQCARLASGKAFCWGLNDQGQVGDGLLEDRLNPQPLDALTGKGVVEIEAGSYSTAVVTSGGEVVVWGASSGLLGNGVFPAPTKVAQAPAGATKIRLGEEDHRAFVFSGSGLLTMFENSPTKGGRLDQFPGATAFTDAYSTQAFDVGLALIGSQTSLVFYAANPQLAQYGVFANGGSDVTTFSSVPIAAIGLTSYRHQAYDKTHACAFDGAGMVVCWGPNLSGECGQDPQSSDYVLTPSAVAVPGVTTAMCAGDHFTCSVVQTGEVYCWGTNDTGQLGTSSPDTFMPTKVDLTASAKGISCGPKHACAHGDGGIYCWGQNAWGQLGNGQRTPTEKPSQIGGLGAIARASTGVRHTCAVEVGGKVSCWGSAFPGQLGDGSTGTLAKATQVAGLP